MEKKDLKRSRVQYQYDNDEDTQDLYEKHLKNISNNTDNNTDASNVKLQCEACGMFGEDNRNEYFTKLLQEELKYVTPCMRSRVYVKILNFLNSVKKYHTQDIEVTDTEKISVSLSSEMN